VRAELRRFVQALPSVGAPSQLSKNPVIRAFQATVDSRAKPCCEPRSFADQSILIEVMNTIMSP